VRAKYYPSCEILKDRPKAGSSFTHQSIMAGVQTFLREDVFEELVLGLPSTSGMIIGYQVAMTTKLSHREMVLFSQSLKS
jgi:hypothetical protein